MIKRAESLAFASSTFAALSLMLVMGAQVWRDAPQAPGSLPVITMETTVITAERHPSPEQLAQVH